MKKKLITLIAVFAMISALFTGCGESTSDEKDNASGTDRQVVIYSNADDEAVEAMTATLNENGYEGKFIFQSFGTSELGGKLLAEGSDIEADVVTMSTYYIDSAQEQHKMFKDLKFDVKTTEESPSYCAPFLANQGAIILNTEVMNENNLPVPKSIKDLTNPIYKGFISVVDIEGSSTAWLMVQALAAAYGEDEAQEILTALYENAGAHLEQSGSGPIKKVRAGEVAIGFGLRHQAISDKEEGLPIDFIDPEEGSYTLKEGLAAIDHGKDTNPLAAEMVQCIIEKGRPALMKYYPVPLYDGEKQDKEAISSKSRNFPEPLSVELLEKHLSLSEAAKENMKK